MREQDYQSLLQALGLTADATIILNDTMTPTALKPLPLSHCIQAALLHNTTYQAAQFNLREKRRALMMAKNQAQWELNLTASTSVGASTGSAIVPAGTPNTVVADGVGPSAGVTLNIPLNDVQAKQAVVNARVALEQAEVAFQALHDNLIRTITREVQQINNGLAQIHIAHQTVRLEQDALNAERLKLHYGKSTVFEVNQLQTEWLSAATQAISTEINVLNDISSLDNDMGTLLDKWQVKLRA